MRCHPGFRDSMALVARLTLSKVWESPDGNERNPCRCCGPFESVLSLIPNIKAWRADGWMFNLKTPSNSRPLKCCLPGIGSIQEPSQGSSASSSHHRPAHTLEFACPLAMTRGSGTGCWSESPPVAEGHCGVHCHCERGSMPRHLVLSLSIAYWLKTTQSGRSAHIAT